MTRASIAAASRTPDEREGDLRAQFAANRRGAERLREWLPRAGFAAAAAELQDHSERFMRSILADCPRGSWTFEDHLDGDGHDSGPIPIRCRVTLDGRQARVDFTGTAPGVRGPVNVPRAVTVSAVMYAFRCLAPPELPSNSGYMRCIDVVTEPGSLVDARYPAAVAAGNVETSQRITDVVFGALAGALPERIPAASCGSMNNILIGGTDPTGHPFAYYETIAGGAGAAPGAPGASAVQTHMTNTLNTPIEALEHAYPFRITRYALRDDSGGRGTAPGGDGVVREYTFDTPATVTLMTERRDTPPWGLDGGGPGRTGRNVLIRDNAETLLPAKVSLEVSPGDTIRIETPGGGGAGR